MVEIASAPETSRIYAVMGADCPREHGAEAKGAGWLQSQTWADGRNRRGEGRGGKISGCGPLPRSEGGARRGMQEAFAPLLTSKPLSRRDPETDAMTGCVGTSVPCHTESGCLWLEVHSLPPTSTQVSLVKRQSCLRDPIPCH